ncbi:hypothetical protein CKJ66_26965 [Mycobacterium avium]|uniref:Uncharacterized protein n=1 Tax=Mycobacterium avium TaxID=1764 RepID=A0A2A2ZB79_MYCAV|nr:hypothetical protein [Mycobacterium avium]PBA23726.1 hypothetical protein CKJ66_26965 [Mycobacterium avium]
MTRPPSVPARIVIPRTLRSAAERCLAAIATLHQPITSSSDLSGPSCGQCAERWPCSTALLLGPWPIQNDTGPVGQQIVIPEGKTAAETRTTAIGALHQPILEAGALAALSGPSCRQCSRWPCATAQLIGAWPSLQPSDDLAAVKDGHDVATDVRPTIRPRSHDTGSAVE